MTSNTSFPFPVRPTPRKKANTFVSQDCLLRSPYQFEFSPSSICNGVRYLLQL